MENWILLVRYMANRLREEGYLTENYFYSLVRMPIGSPEELAEIFRAMSNAVERREFYRLIERIDKGRAMIEAETDPQKRRAYQKFMTRLVKILESEVP